MDHLLYNKMQAQFLNTDLLINISKNLHASTHTLNKQFNEEKGLETNITASMKFEIGDNAVVFEIHTTGTLPRGEIKPWLLSMKNTPPKDFYEYKTYTMEKSRFNTYLQRLETGEVFPPIITGTQLDYRVFIVPSIKDDYPLILKQILSKPISCNYYPICYYLNYNGAMDITKVEQMFNVSGVYMVQCNTLLYGDILY